MMKSLNKKLRKRGQRGTESRGCPKNNNRYVKKTLARNSESSLNQISSNNNNTNIKILNPKSREVKYNIPCRKYLCGKCEYGAKCRFTHVERNPNPCRNFMEHGVCKFGDSCLFTHMTPDEFIVYDNARKGVMSNPSQNVSSDEESFYKDLYNDDETQAPNDNPVEDSTKIDWGNVFGRSNCLDKINNNTVGNNNNIDNDIINLDKLFGVEPIILDDIPVEPQISKTTSLLDKAPKQVVNNIEPEAWDPNYVDFDGDVFVYIPEECPQEVESFFDKIKRLTLNGPNNNKDGPGFNPPDKPLKFKIPDMKDGRSTFQDFKSICDQTLNFWRERMLETIMEAGLLTPHVNWRGDYALCNYLKIYQQWCGFEEHESYPTIYLCKPGEVDEQYYDYVVRAPISRSIGICINKYVAYRNTRDWRLYYVDNFEYIMPNRRAFCNSPYYGNKDFQVYTYGPQKGTGVRMFVPNVLTASVEDLGIPITYLDLDVEKINLRNRSSYVLSDFKKELLTYDHLLSRHLCRANHLDLDELMARSFTYYRAKGLLKDCTEAAKLGHINSLINRVDRFRSGKTVEVPDFMKDLTQNRHYYIDKFMKIVLLLASVCCVVSMFLDMTFIGILFSLIIAGVQMRSAYFEETHARRLTKRMEYAFRMAIILADFPLIIISSLYGNPFATVMFLPFQIILYILPFGTTTHMAFHMAFNFLSILSGSYLSAGVIGLFLQGVEILYKTRCFFKTRGLYREWKENVKNNVRISFDDRIIAIDEIDELESLFIEADQNAQILPSVLAPGGMSQYAKVEYKKDDGTWAPFEFDMAVEVPRNPKDGMYHVFPMQHPFRKPHKGKNAIAAVYNRLLPKRPVDDKCTCQACYGKKPTPKRERNCQVAKDWRAAMKILDMLGESMAKEMETAKIFTEENLDPTSWIATRSPGKRLLYQQALLELRTRLIYCIYMQVKPDEKLVPKYDKGNGVTKTRNIYPMHTTAIVQTGPAMAFVTEIFKDYFKHNDLVYKGKRYRILFASGLKPGEIDEFFDKMVHCKDDKMVYAMFCGDDMLANYCINKKRYFVELDFSSWDASCNWHSQKAEFAFYRKLGVPSHIIKVLEKCAYAPKYLRVCEMVLRVTARICRLSGGSNTSIGNTIINMAMFVEVHSSTQGFPVRMKDRYSNYGFSLSQWNVTEDPTQCTFLRGMWYDALPEHEFEYIWAPLPSQVLKYCSTISDPKDWTPKNADGTFKYDPLQFQAFALSFACGVDIPEVPLLKEHLTRMREYGSGIDIRDIHEYEAYMRSKDGYREYRVQSNSSNMIDYNKAYDAICHRYDIDPEELTHTSFLMRHRGPRDFLVSPVLERLLIKDYY